MPWVCEMRIADVGQAFTHTPQAAQVGRPDASSRMNGGPRKGSLAAGLMRLPNPRRRATCMARTTCNRSLAVVRGGIADLMVALALTAVLGPWRAGL